MGNGVVITGLSSSFTLDTDNFNADVSSLMYRGNAVEKATAALPATTTGNLFTITGGRVLFTGIVGEVTTVIETQTCNAKVVFDPTITGSNVDMCANLDVTGAVLASLFSITGTAANAMVNGLAVAAMVTPWVLQPGAIALTTSATNTGSVKWKMWYIPIDSGATVASA
jgi:hypothetical protein